MLTALYLIAVLIRALPVLDPAPDFPIPPACDTAGEGCRYTPPPGKMTGREDGAQGWITRG
jgi:hypothetical protein